MQREKWCVSSQQLFIACCRILAPHHGRDRNPYFDSSGNHEPLLWRRGAVHGAPAAGGRGPASSRPKREEEKQKEEQEGPELWVLHLVLTQARKKKRVFVLQGWAPEWIQLGWLFCVFVPLSWASPGWVRARCVLAEVGSKWNNLLLTI